MGLPWAAASCTKRNNPRAASTTSLSLPSVLVCAILMARPPCFEENIVLETQCFPSGGHLCHYQNLITPIRIRRSAKAERRLRPILFKESRDAKTWIHARRVVGGDCHHWHLDCPLV